MEKKLQWIWPSECYTWCHRNFNTRHIYLCPSQICFPQHKHVATLRVLDI